MDAIKIDGLEVAPYSGNPHIVWVMPQRQRKSAAP